MALSILTAVIDFIILEEYLGSVPITRIEYVVKQIIKSMERRKLDFPNKYKERLYKLYETIPSHIDFEIRHNIAVKPKIVNERRTKFENTLPISELLKLDGLTESHRVYITREEHHNFAVLQFHYGN